MFTLSKICEIISSLQLSWQNYEELIRYTYSDFTVVTDDIYDQLSELEGHIVNHSEPQWNSWKPPTKASAGPQYNSLDELIEKRHTRGLRLKPHYIREEDYS